MERPAIDEPRLARVWDVELIESDSLYVGRPSEFTVSPRNGYFLVSDRFFGHVVEYDRNGRARRVFGRKGEGPGEFVDVARSFVAGSSLFVADAALSRISEFDLATGAYVGGMRYEGILTHATAWRDTVLLGLESPERQTGAALWLRNRDATVYFARYPKAYADSNPLAGIFDGVAVATAGEKILLAFMGDDSIRVYAKRNLERIETVPQWWRKRTGVPKDVVRKLDRMTFPEMFSAVSGLTALGVTPDGRIVTVHNDQTIEGRAISGHAFVSVLNSHHDAWCADAQIPGPFDGQPQSVVIGDTVMVLSQTVVEEATRTHITAYVIDTGGCRWHSVR